MAENNSSQTISVGESESLIRFNSPASLFNETLSLVGHAYKGPAFVPIQVEEYFQNNNPNSPLNTFENVFGLEKNNYSKASNLANVWLNNGGQQLCYTRILGIGNNNDPDADTGIVPESGFIVGNPNTRNSVVTNKIGNNKLSQTTFIDTSGDPFDVNDSANNLSLKDGNVFFYCEHFTDNTGRDTFQTINPSKNIIKQFGKSINEHHIVYERTIEIVPNYTVLRTQINESAEITITDTDNQTILISFSKAGSPTSPSEIINSINLDEANKKYTIYANDHSILKLNINPVDIVNNITYYMYKICKDAIKRGYLNSSFSCRSEFNKFIIGSNYYNLNWLENDSIDTNSFVANGSREVFLLDETKAVYNFTSFLNTKVFMTPQGNYLSLNPTVDNTDNIASTFKLNNIERSYGIESTTFSNYDISKFVYDINNSTLNTSLKNLAVLNDSSITTADNSRKILGSYISLFINSNNIDGNINNRIFISGLNSNETAENNTIDFNTNNRTNLFENIKPSLTVNGVINKSFYRMYEKGYVEYASFDSNDYIKRIQDSSTSFRQILDHPKSSLESKYKNFQSIFTKSKTPWVVSQITNKSKEDIDISGSNNDNILSNITSNLSQNRNKIEEKCKNLFRFHAVDDGEVGNRFRIRITPKKLGKKSFYKKRVANEFKYNHIWSTFDIEIFEYDINSNTFSTVLSYKNVNLNKDDSNYICRLFGTERVYWDRTSDRIVKEGFYPQTNNYLYVEVDEDVESKNIDSTLMPSGFRSYPYIDQDLDYLDLNNKLVAHNMRSQSGEDFTISKQLLADAASTVEEGPFIGNGPYDISYKLDLFNNFYYDDFGNKLNLIQKPLEFKSNLNINSNFELSDIENDHWGVSFTDQISKVKNSAVGILNLLEGTENYDSDKFEFTKYELEDNVNPGKYRQCFEYSKFFQNSRTDSDNVWIEEDNKINSMFHLEKILYRHFSNELNDRWLYSFYRKDGEALTEIFNEYAFYEKLYKDDMTDAAVEAASMKTQFNDGTYRYVNIDELLSVSGNITYSENSKYLKFDFFTYGGFDGTNKFDIDKDNFTNISLVRELENEDDNLATVGSTYTSYNKGIDLATRVENSRIDIFCVPGITHKNVLRKIRDIVEDKKSFISVVDIPTITETGEFVSDIYFEENYEYPDDTEKTLKLWENFDVSTTSSLTNFNKLNIKSRFLCPVYNNIISKNIVPEGADDVDILKTNMYLPSSYMFVKSAAETYFRINSDISSVDSNSTSSIYSITEMLDKNLVQENNELTNMIRLSEAYNINVISREGNSDDPLKLNSSNTSFDNKNSVFRLFHNNRIFIQIKKDLMYSLYGLPPSKINIKTPGILFNQFITNKLIDSDKQTENIIDGVLSFYVNSGFIKNYFIKFDKNNTISKSLSNILYGKVFIQFFTLEEDSLEEINLNNLLSEKSELTNNLNVDIINIR